MFFRAIKISRKVLIAICSMLLLGLSVYFFESGLYVFTLSPLKYKPIYQGNPHEKKIALTCNVAWGTEYLPGMLKLLEDKQIKITFFLQGNWVEANPELAKQIYLAGHEIGNHAYSHPHVEQLSLEENKKEILKTEEIIKGVTGHKTTLYAPPYGEYNDIVLAAAHELGYKTILWSLDTVDWAKPGVEVMVDRIVKRAHNGAIVLFHPTDQTLLALPQIIDGLRSQGYELVPVSSIIGNS